MLLVKNPWFYYIKDVNSSIRLTKFPTLILICFALFTIRPLVSQFELTLRPWCIKKSRIWSHFLSSLFNKLKKDVIWKPFLKASRGAAKFCVRQRHCVVESDRKLSKANTKGKCFQFEWVKFLYKVKSKHIT